MFVSKSETASSKNEIRRSNSAALMGASSGVMIFSLTGGAVPGRTFIFVTGFISSSCCIRHLLPVICGGFTEDVGAAKPPYFGDTSVLPVLHALRTACTWVYSKLSGNFSGAAKAVDQVRIWVCGRVHTGDYTLRFITCQHAAFNTWRLLS
ncbi:hypothetical protein B398_09920 [Xylella fastidiosa 32]|nr:hypothetical protein B398_09920 [Xylella fastidiosa 32]